MKPYSVVIQLTDRPHISCGHNHKTREAAVACKARLADKEDGSIYDWTGGFDWSDAVVIQPARRNLPTPVTETIQSLKKMW